MIEVTREATKEEEEELVVVVDQELIEEEVEVALPADLPRTAEPRTQNTMRMIYPSGENHHEEDHSSPLSLGVHSDRYLMAN